jgi:hypothetical protein
MSGSIQCFTTKVTYKKNLLKKTVRYKVKRLHQHENGMSKDYYKKEF